MAQQKIAARIKRSSKYADQAPPQTWFVVEIDGGGGHPIGGNSNHYRFDDVTLGATVAGGVVEFATGKMVETEVAGLRLREDA